MVVVDVTFPTPEQNLACDEALLDWCEQDGPRGLLRFWEPPRHFVVLGYGNRAASEVRLAACRRRRVPVLRRCSGGGAVLQGPGCLNFSLVLPIPRTGPLSTITGTNRAVMERHARALGPLAGGPVSVRGATDLALGDRKFSGNSQRRKRTHLLFHGCFLLGLDLRLMEQLLPMPGRQPAYRDGRPHRAFVTNIPAEPAQVRAALSACWRAAGRLPAGRLPAKKIQELVRTRYALPAWNERL